MKKVLLADDLHRCPGWEWAGGMVDAVERGREAVGIGRLCHGGHMGPGHKVVGPGEVCAWRWVVLGRPLRTLNWGGIRIRRLEG